MYRERSVFLKINKQIQDPIKLRSKKRNKKWKGMTMKEASKIPAASEQDSKSKGKSITGAKENICLHDYDIQDNPGEGET